VTRDSVRVTCPSCYRETDVRPGDLGCSWCGEDVPYRVVEAAETAVGRGGEP